MSFNKEIVNVKSVQFTVLGNDDIKRISVLDANGVIYPDTYDNSEPKIGGIIDPRLGVTDQFMLCSFCKQNYMECPGHFGHVKLTEPVFHFGFIHYVKNVLSCVCFKTCKLLISKEDISKKVINNRNQKQRFNEIKTLCASVKYSPYSGIPTPSLKVETRKSVGTIQIIAEYTVNQADDFDIGKNVTIDNISDTKKKVVQVLTAADCYHILSNISDEDCYLIGIPRPENMIIINFPVPPVAIRPSLRGDFTSMGYSEHGTTHKLSDIVKFNNKLGKEKEKALSTNDNSKYLKDYQDCLQYHVATFFDNESTQLPKSELKSGGNAAKSITSRFKGGKTGRIRGNLQGKRVDFSARTVITSDPNNNLDELGVPLKIAMIVTYPEIVTDANIDYLRLLIKNGRSKYPGANFIENTSIIGPNGKPVKIDLGYKNEGIVLQKGWIVHRHLQNEDYVLFNRQPSLHKMSMMTHKVKVIENSDYITFRLNVTATTPYNADFDGDEMNLFAPQSEQAKIELMMLADIKNHIISPKDSKPIVNLKQDSLLGAYKFTSDLNKLSWKECMNLLAYTSVAKDILAGQVKIQKNKTFEGRDVFSLLIPDKVNITNDKTVIKNGNIVSGMLAKKELGGSKNNIPHLIIDSYNKDKSAIFMDNTQRMVNMWLMSIFGFGVGLGDAYISPTLKEQFKKFNQTKILEMQNLLTENENNRLIDKEYFEEIMFREMNNCMASHAKTLMKTLDIHNNFFVMIESGSKGKDINMGMIMGCIGQSAFGNKLMEKRFNNRTLSHFAKHDDSASARGFITNGYIDGSTATEFFFHQMDGRVGVIDTAIKSVTGDTELIIIEEGKSKLVKIGEWIDKLIFDKANEVTVDTSENEMREELKITKTLIPTTDLNGKVTWGDVTGVTRHNPSKVLYEIKTNGGRKVTVTDSHSLLIWNELKRKLERLEPTKIKLGNCVPVTANLHKANVNFNTFENFSLTNENGILIGILLVRGYTCNNRVHFRLSQNEECFTFIREWCEKNEVKYYDTHDDNLINIRFEHSVLTKLYDTTTQMKRIPNWCFNAPVDFIRGIINGMYSLNGNFTKDFIKFSFGYCPALLQDLNFLLSRLGIFGKLNKDNLTIRGQWVKKFAEQIELLDENKKTLLNTIVPSIKSRDFKEFNNVVLDKIIEINIIKPKSNEKVYDLTVPSTLNFGLANGLHVVDTADTGYMQKKTIKATEDVYLAYDGTVRNSINGIVQYVYGDNSYDTAKQMQVKCNLISMDNPTVKEKYLFSDSEVKEFSYDKKRNIEFYEDILHLRDILRSLQRKMTFSSKKIVENYNLPFNLQRVISYHVNKQDKPNKQTGGKKSKKAGKLDLITPDEIIEEIEKFLNIFSYMNASHIIKLNNSKKHKHILRTLIYEYLAPKRIIVEYKIGKNTFHEIMADLRLSYKKNLAQSCEMVGILAAQSIGEPLTQFTLNTFHSTGVSDVTSNMSAMVRIKELISYSKNIKAPYMKIYLTDEFKYNEDKAKLLSNVIENTMISNITLGTEIYFEPDHTMKNSIHSKDSMSDNVKNMFFVSSSNKNVSIKSLPWLFRFIINREMLLNKNITLLDIKTQFIKMWNETYTELKGFKKKERDIINLVSNICILSNSDNDPTPVVHIRLDLKEYDYQVIMDIMHLINNTFKIKGVDGITKAVVVKENEKTYDENGKLEDRIEYVISTQGINLKEIFYLEGIDSSRTVTNDVHSTFNIYGIEATRSILLKEINEIFSSQGQDLNYQHLSILVDIMCQNGSVTPLNRYGINKLDTDPLSRASFEKTIEQLLQAAIFNEKDRVNSVSSRIIAGRVINGGTGMVDLLIDVDKLETTEFLEIENDTIPLLKADPFITDLF